MQGTYKAIIADTSCLILLDKIDAVSILRKLFGTITTSVEIAQEFGKPLPEWATNFRISPKLFGDILKAAGE